ncbi:MAG TPA: pyridoxamine 5'-phosphate oxidase [Bacillales bacterium]|nr:pyridoxamine 5'-phosphate oxidase [Bacillales bacterium]
MAKERLSADLVDFLQENRVVSLITVNRESRLPELTTVSWVRTSQNGGEVRIAVMHKASSVKNLLVNDHATLGVIGAGSCWSIEGRATVSEVIRETMKFRVVTLKVEKVKNVIFYGGEITADPAYIRNYNPVLAEKLDEEAECLLRRDHNENELLESAIEKVL